jgi:phosphoglycolate phosphatase
MGLTSGTVLFDFDGTLADTEGSMRESLNSLAREFGFPPITDAEKVALRRMDAREFLSKRLGIPIWNSIKVRRLLRQAKRAFEMRADSVHLFPEASDLVRSLHENGCRVGIVSTNSDAVIRRVLGGLNADIDFIRTGSMLMGKSRPIRRILREYRLDPATVVYVSDEVRDAHLCRRVGIPMIGVAWGLNDSDALRAQGIDVALTWDDLKEKLTAHLARQARRA